jgi:hypothetical protein
VQLLSACYLLRMQSLFNAHWIGPRHHRCGAEEGSVTDSLSKIMFASSNGVWWDRTDRASGAREWAATAPICRIHAS